MADQATTLHHQALIRRGLWLNYASLLYNVLEGIIALAAGLLAGSIALVGFGADSMIEVTASVAAQWRLRAHLDPLRRERVEQVTVRIVGWCFLLLALYVGYDSLRSLLLRERPSESSTGIVLTALSVVIMPLLARAKRRVATDVGSRALVAEARQTSLCAYLSAIVLGGLVLNAVLGWWWADPVAALCMVPIIAREGVEGLRGEKPSDECC
jgi:divalent metal cation (Fe/Co/Zn/Cd) transporter